MIGSVVSIYFHDLERVNNGAQGHDRTPLPNQWSDFTSMIGYEPEIGRKEHENN